MADPAGDLYGKGLGQRWALDWSAGLSAPVTEELAKGAGLLIGLGLQTLDDISYALRDAPAMGSTIVLRMVTGVSGHFAYSAIFCAGLVYLLCCMDFGILRGQLSAGIRCCCSCCGCSSWW